MALISLKYPLTVTIENIFSRLTALFQPDKEKSIIHKMDANMAAPRKSLLGALKSPLKIQNGRLVFT